MTYVQSMSVASSVPFFYPRMLVMHDIKPDGKGLPDSLRLSYERLEDDGVYLLENGLVMQMWLGRAVDPQWLEQVFGVASPQALDVTLTDLPVLANPLSQRVRDIVEQVRSERERFLKLDIIRQKDATESRFIHYMLEDKGLDTMSYVDFLCYIHRQIQSNLS
eukprot:Colp12_sorted_trinity150504_noHs@25632